VAVKIALFCNVDKEAVITAIDVKSIYEYFGATLGPLGLEFDYERIKKIRPKIVKMLQK